MSNEKQLTKGQELVGVTFNPSNSEKVDRVKQLYSEIADIVYEMLDERETVEGINVCNTALEKIVTAKMWTVESIFKK